MGSLTTLLLDLMEFICLLRPGLGCTLGLLHLWSWSLWQQSLPLYWSSGNTASQSSKHDLLACLNEINMLRAVETHQPGLSPHFTSQRGDVQILSPEGDGRAGFSRSRGGRWQGAQRRGNRVRRGQCIVTSLIVAFTVTSHAFHNLSFFCFCVTGSSGININQDLTTWKKNRVAN